MSEMNEDKRRLKELVNEAAELERVLKQEHQQHWARNDDSGLNEEIEFLRNSLKDLYEDVLLSDLQFASEHKIGDKLWRLVFHSPVEELRTKLYNIKPDSLHEYQVAYLELCRYLDIGTGFYHSIANCIRIHERVNIDKIGIELFHMNSTSRNHNLSPSVQMENHRRELTAECIQQCFIHLGDFARYRDMALGSVEEQSQLTQQYYITASRLYCDNGKAQAQLAVLSAFYKNDLDTVYWYVFSLATRHPSPIAENNLRIFYTQLQPTVSCDITSPSIGTFTRKFLSMHKHLFGQNFDSLQVCSKNVQELKEMFDVLLSVKPFHVNSLGHVLTKVLFILIFTCWKLRYLAVTSQVVGLQQAQATTIALGTGLCASTLSNMYAVLEMHDTCETEFKSTAMCLLSAVSMWCSYLEMVMDILANIFAHAKTLDKETLSPILTFQMYLSSFLKAFVQFLNHPKVALLLDENSKDPAECVQHTVPEDIAHLGFMPLHSFHQNLDLKVTTGVDAVKVWLARLVSFGHKFNDSKIFEMFCYDEGLKQFVIVDGEMKKKERQRLMQLMAQQRLREQVNSLEHNLEMIGISKKKTVHHCVVDVGILLDHLQAVRKWVAESICMVIIPLDVIDSLDLLKKVTAFCYQTTKGYRKTGTMGSCREISD